MFTTKTTLHGPECPGCAGEVEKAITMATVRGSVEATSRSEHRGGDGVLVVDHSATVIRTN